MLPPELLQVVFEALSRDDLDVLVLTRFSFSEIVLRDFVKTPFRYVAELNICGHKDYEFLLPTGDKYTCKDDDDLCRRMGLARVGELKASFVTLFDENVFKVLLPHKDAWRDGHVHMRCSFESQSLLERAFSQLLFCKSSSLYEPSQPFLSLPAVRERTALDIPYLTNQPSEAAIFEWLNADVRSMEPRRLDVAAYYLRISVVNLVQQLKTDFSKSAKACRYVLTVYGRTYDGQSDRIDNKNTSEVLVVSHGIDDDGVAYVKVDRHPTDEFQ